MCKVVYEDNHLLIVVKPPNLLTQGDATGDECLLDKMKRYVKAKYQKPGEVYLGCVHRLDRPVGGLVAIARTSKAASRLSEQLRGHAMQREYLAVVQGIPTASEGNLTDWLLKDEATGSVRCVPEGTPGAQLATLHWRKLAVNPSAAKGTAAATIPVNVAANKVANAATNMATNMVTNVAESIVAHEAGKAVANTAASAVAATLTLSATDRVTNRAADRLSGGTTGTALLHLQLETGRKHQIRVQLAHFGHPIVQDLRYGAGTPGEPIALWGAVLRLTHPTLKTPMTFVSRPEGTAFDRFAEEIDAFLAEAQAKTP